MSLVPKHQDYQVIQDLTILGNQRLFIGNKRQFLIITTRPTTTDKQSNSLPILFQVDPAAS